MVNQAGHRYLAIKKLWYSYIPSIHLRPLSIMYVDINKICKRARQDSIGWFHYSPFSMYSMNTVILRTVTITFAGCQKLKWQLVKYCCPNCPNKTTKTKNNRTLECGTGFSTSTCQQTDIQDQLSKLFGLTNDNSNRLADLCVSVLYSLLG